MKPERPGLNGMRTDVAQVPVAASTESFSSRPLMAPPPLGRDRREQIYSTRQLRLWMPSPAGRGSAFGEGVSATSASRPPSCGPTSTPRIGVTHSEPVRTPRPIGGRVSRITRRTTGSTAGCDPTTGPRRCWARDLGWAEDQCWTLARITQVVAPSVRRGGPDCRVAGGERAVSRLAWTLSVPVRGFTCPDPVSAGGPMTDRAGWLARGLLVCLPGVRCTDPNRKLGG